MCYVLGLVLLVRFRSIREIATRLANGAVDTLHHFAHDSPWREETVERARQKAIGKRARRHRGATRLILDDTPFEREGKHIEGLGVHHGAKGLVKGLRAVTAVVRIGKQVWCWAIRGCRPKRGCPPGTFRLGWESCGCVRGGRSNDTGRRAAWRTTLSCTGSFRNIIAAVPSGRSSGPFERKSLCRRLFVGIRVSSE
jgi:hypothetical protein